MSVVCRSGHYNAVGDIESSGDNRPNKLLDVNLTSYFWHNFVSHIGCSQMGGEVVEGSAVRECFPLSPVFL